MVRPLPVTGAEQAVRNFGILKSPGFDVNKLIDLVREAKANYDNRTATAKEETFLADTYQQAIQAFHTQIEHRNATQQKLVNPDLLVLLRGYKATKTAREKQPGI